ncbi:MAG: TonB-dependent receptor [Gemmatimonadetes bacterium]|nr:TonB-dependent receptor [Gemmatimonadota bacterium]
MNTGRWTRLGLAALAFFALLAGPGGVAAQAPRDTASKAPAAPDSVAYELEGLIVEASRPVAAMAGASAVELRLDSLNALPSATMGEVLRRMPFVRIRRNSRGEDQPSLRGVEERQLAVLVDGIPITLGWDSRTDLSLIPLTAAREVTVVRGLSSVLAGPNALGGVIMVGITGGPFPERLTRPFRLQTGVEHTGAVSLAGEADGLWRSGDGGLLVRAGAGYRDIPGLARPGDVSQPAGGERLLNTDLSHQNGFLAARYRARSGRWASLSSLAFRAEKGVLPELHVQQPRFWRIPSVWRSVTALSAGTGWQRTPWGRGDLEAMVGIDLGHQQTDAYESFDFQKTLATERADSRTLTVRLLGEHSLGPGILRTALTLADTRNDQREPDNPGVFEQRLWSMGVEAERPLARGGAAGSWFADPVLNIGLSADGAATPQSGGRPRRDAIHAWGARVAGSALVARGAARLHGGVSRKVRFPALRELYSGALGRFEPNPELGPEVLKVGELGITGSFGPVEAQLTLFQQRLEGAIVRTSTAAGKFRRENRDEMRSTGVELLANWHVGALSLGTDLTLQDVQVLDPTARAGERRAEYQPEIASGLRLYAPLPLDLRGWASVFHVGRQHCVHPDLNRMVTVDPSVSLDVGTVRRIEPRVPGIPPLRVGVTVANLTDAVVYEQCGLPREGRTLRVQVEVF